MGYQGIEKERNEERWDEKKERIHRWARYFKKVAERALNAKKNFLSASALQGL